MTDFVALLTSFHFLRPWWLLALLLVPLLVMLAQHATKNRSSWAQAIHPRLLQHLLHEHSERTEKWPLYVFTLCCVLGLIALAGPVWKKIPQPVHQPDDALVIVLDQSLSMLASDLKPSRQVVTQRKLIDILNARQQGQTALLVYAGDAHTVAPLTDDTGTIAAMVPALSPLIMPALGSRVGNAMQLASQLLEDGGSSKGRILLITDGIQETDIQIINQQLKTSQHQLAILAVGTAQGGPIPLPERGFLRQDNNIVIANTDYSRLQRLAHATGAAISDLKLDDSDINQLLPDPLLNTADITRKTEREMDQWREEGIWLVLMILPFAALAFRRGWLLSVFLVILVQPSPAEATEGSELASGLWQTPDQQGAKAFKNKDYKNAQQYFESNQWQGTAAYRAGDFEAAAQHFAQADTAAAHYNRGNALAKAGQLEEAIKAYESALERDPQLADAQTNKALLEQLQGANPQTQPSQSSSQNSEPSNAESQPSDSADTSQQQGQNQHQDKSSQAQQPEPAPEPESEADSSAAAQNEQQQQQNADEGEQPSEQTVAQDTSEAQQLTEEEQQAMEQWLRRIPDDPSGLLKRKFNYQYQLNQRNNQFVPQQENDTIW